MTMAYGFSIHSYSSNIFDLGTFFKQMIIFSQNSIDVNRLNVELTFLSKDNLQDCFRLCNCMVLLVVFDAVYEPLPC